MTNELTSKTHHYINDNIMNKKVHHTTNGVNEITSEIKCF